MTILEDLLPLLEGWRFQFVPTTVYAIPAGVNQQMYEIKGKSGWILTAGITTDQPLTVLQMEHHGPKGQTRIIQNTPFGINAIGLNVNNGSGIWVSVYNAVLGVYTLVAIPNSRLGWWDDALRLSVTAPAAATANITFGLGLIVVQDEQLFRKSWHKLWQSQYILIDKKVKKK